VGRRCRDQVLAPWPIPVASRRPRLSASLDVQEYVSARGLPASLGCSGLGRGARRSRDSPRVWRFKDARAVAKAMKEGLIARKRGMTQIFGNEGNATPVTVLEAGPCTVVQIKTRATDGYEAIQVGFEPK